MLFIFDIGGVVTKGTAIYSLISTKLGISPEKFVYFCGKPYQAAIQDPSLMNNHDKQNQISTEQKTIYKRDISLELTKGLINSNEFWKIFSVRSQLNITENYWATLFNPVRNEQIYKLIERLKRTNRVVCGTNTIQDHYNKHMFLHDYDIFDAIYASQEMHEAKPEINFWKYILKKENVKPQDTFFIDDSKANIEAASTLNINTCLYTDNIQLENKLANWLN